MQEKKRTIVTKHHYCPPPQPKLQSLACCHQGCVTRNWWRFVVDNCDCWHKTMSASVTGWTLFKVGTQLDECRYKFLCRWAQYGSHSGTRVWEINLYPTGGIRASAWSLPFVDLLFFFALFFSNHLHQLIGARSWLSGLRSAYLPSMQWLSTVFARWLLSRFIEKITGGNWSFGSCMLLFAVRITGDRKVNISPSSVLKRLRRSTSGSREELLLLDFVCFSLSFLFG